MHLHRTTLHLLALTILFTGFAGYTFMNAAWTPPLDPPTANVDAPINVGSIDQVKSAGLSVDALSVIGGSMGITSPGPRIKMTNTSTVPPSFDWWLYANGPSFYLIADRDGNGNWNTPAEAPWPMQVVVGATSTSDFVKFSNAVRSPKYCDEVGLNCFLASSLGKSEDVYKLCTAITPGNWRDTIIVPSTWTAATCASFATTQGATLSTFGCIAGDKYYLRNDHACDAASKNPIPSNKFCSVVVPGSWRDTMAVPSSWSNSECADYARTVGATSHTMGCFTATSFVFGNTTTCNTGGSTDAADMKICSAVVGGNWRDTVNVPASWDYGTCASFQSSTGAAESGIGCVLPSGFSYGDTLGCS